MKIIKKYYKRQYKDRRYFFYTKVILFGFIDFGWSPRFYTTPSNAKHAGLELESRGFEFYHE